MASKYTALPVSEAKWATTSDDGTEETGSSSRGFRYMAIAALAAVSILLIFTSASTYTILSPSQEDFIPFQLNAYAPQTVEEDLYRDRLVALNTSDPIVPNTTNTKGLRYAILLPTFSGHFAFVVDFFQSLKCLCTDFQEVDFNIIVSDYKELQALELLLSQLEPCNSTFSRFDTPPGNINGPNPRATIVTLYDVLPPTLQKTEGISANDTGPLLAHRGKYIYQSIKKLSAAFHFDYDWALWLDSEAIAVRPFSIRNTFDTYVKHPTIWRSRMSKNQGQHEIMNNTAMVLGRSIESFGLPFWTLESVEWIIEKPIINDLYSYVSAAHATDFWTVWLDQGINFEVNLYNMHIHARKLETVDSIFSKYQVLETEREMIRFGMAPAFPQMETAQGTGFIERGFSLLRHPNIQPNFSGFLSRYGQRLFRMDDLGVADPEVIDRFLLDTPIDLLCSGAPPLHRWWGERVERGEIQVGKREEGEDGGGS